MFYSCWKPYNVKHSSTCNRHSKCPYKPTVFLPGPSQASQTHDTPLCPAFIDAPAWLASRNAPSECGSPHAPSPTSGSPHTCACIHTHLCLGGHLVGGDGALRADGQVRARLIAVLRTVRAVRADDGVRLAAVRHLPGAPARDAGAQHRLGTPGSVERAGARKRLQLDATTPFRGCNCC